MNRTLASQGHDPPNHHAEAWMLPHGCLAADSLTKSVVRNKRCENQVSKLAASTNDTWHDGS
eukprot:1151643-Pelagomonas_calceolata.AAC.5